MSVAEMDRWSHDSIQLWCHKNARYGLPNIETVEWIKQRIGGRSAIEIGAGSGDLCRHLGIRGTDSKLQANNEMAMALYQLAGQPMIQYPEWVVQSEALDAVRYYQPEVVVASWVTNWVDPDKFTGPGCMYGVHEDQILAAGCEYIFIGNLETHKHKPLLKVPHEIHRLPFLRSRATHAAVNVALIWRPHMSAIGS